MVFGTVYNKNCNLYIWVGMDSQKARVFTWHCNSFTKMAQKHYLGCISQKIPENPCPSQLVEHGYELPMQ